MRTPLFLAILLALPAAAQEFQFALPLSGAIFHSPDRSIRLILGFAGAARLSDPVLDGLDAAFLAPDGARALVARDGQLLVARELRSGSPSLESSGAHACADLVAWSDNSATAAVYCRASGAVQLLRKLDSSLPADVEAVDASSLLGRLVAIAVDPRGVSVVAAFEPGGLWRLQPGEPPRLLGALAAPVAIAFDPAGDAVFAADRERCQILEIRQAATAPEMSVFASLPPPECDPGGLAFANHGTRLLLTDTKARTVRAYDLRQRAVTAETLLDFAPTAFFPLISGSLYRLNSPEQADEPLYIFNVAQGAAHFVPAAGRR
jgi:hypothetical protein